jgi:hypothetical protein
VRRPFRGCIVLFARDLRAGVRSDHQVRLRVRSGHLANTLAGPPCVVITAAG